MTVQPPNDWIASSGLTEKRLMRAVFKCVYNNFITTLTKMPIKSATMVFGKFHRFAPCGKLVDSFFKQL